MIKNGKGKTDTPLRPPRGGSEPGGVGAQGALEGAVVVTGASSGIGQACALHLDKMGFRVFAGVRKATDGESLKEQASDRLCPILIDVTDAAAIGSAADIVATAVGEIGLAGLVNNAGIAIAGPLEFLPVTEFRRQLEVSVIGQIAVTQAFLPLLRKGNGRIVNMGSSTGKLALPFLGPYCASKFALEAFTDALRLELRPWGIPVSIVEPGSIATPIWEKSGARMDEFEQNLPQQAHDLYRFALVAKGEAFRKAGASGISAGLVAEVVAQVLTAKRPKTRYIVGRDARAQTAVARFVPDRRRDKIIVRRMGLSRFAPPHPSSPLWGTGGGSTNHRLNKGAVFVTGATSGIGKACALHLDKMGFQVFAGALTEAEGDMVKRQASDRLIPVLIDITDADAIGSAVDTIVTATGGAGLVGLVNNAGIALSGPLEFLPVAEFRRQLEVNVIGQIAVTQKFLPLIRKGHGRIVNMGSIAGRMALPFLGPYCASKFALEALTDALRIELRPWGISVSIVEPGRVVTPMWETSRVTMDKLMEKLPQQAQDLYGSAVVTVCDLADREGAMGSPADVVAQAIVHALTARRPKTRYVVGRDAKLQAILTRFVPDRMRDGLIMRRMGLPNFAPTHPPLGGRGGGRGDHER